MLEDDLPVAVRQFLADVDLTDILCKDENECLIVKAGHNPNAHIICIIT